MREFHHPTPPGSSVESEAKQNSPEDRERHQEKERPLPLINAEEGSFLENTGGEYRGYVQSERGKKEFEDFKLSRVAYYDEHRREVVETFIATDRQLTIDRLRVIARDVHDAVAQLTPHTQAGELRRRVEARLRDEGWHTSQQAR